MKPVMLLGRTGAGKTTLIKVLTQASTPARKTQMVEFKDGMIDTPGEFAEMPGMYHCLIATAQQSSAVLVVQDAVARRPTLPPLFCKVFRVPVFGVVTKLDRPDARPEVAEQFLEQSGVPRPYFRVSAVTGDGLADLHQFVSHLRGGCP